MPHRALETMEQALASIRERGVLPLTSVGGSASLVELVAGRPVKGSWTDDPAGERILAIATALEASPEVLVLKLVGGKVTFVHASLWPALVRVARDPDRAARIVPGLSPAAGRLYEEVERTGEAHLDALGRQNSWPPERDLARAAKELESGLLVHCSSVLGERGRQSIALRSWSRAMPDSARRNAAHLTLEAALDALREHGAVLAPSSAAGAVAPRSRVSARARSR
jgi:hypothetical protein